MKLKNNLKSLSMLKAKSIAKYLLPVLESKKYITKYSLPRLVIFRSIELMQAQKSQRHFPKFSYSLLCMDDVSSGISPGSNVLQAIILPTKPRQLNETVHMKLTLVLLSLSLNNLYKVLQNFSYMKTST